MTAMPPFNGSRERDTLTVTPAADVTSTAVRVYVRPGLALVSVSATLDADLAVGTALFTMPDGCHPPLTVFGDLVNALDESAIRVRIDGGTGVVRTDPALLDGSILRGQFLVPL